MPPTAYADIFTFFLVKQRLHWGQILGTRKQLVYLVFLVYISFNFLSCCLFYECISASLLTSFSAVDSHSNKAINCTIMDPWRISDNYYNINQQNTEIFEDPDQVGKMTFETEEAVIA
jgi:hypothetical protein